MEEIDQIKDQGKNKKRLREEMRDKINLEQLMVINGRGKNTQNSEKELQSRASSKSDYTCGN